jgi:hypothetical protein
MPELYLLDQLPPWSPPTVAAVGLGQAGIRGLNALLQAPVRGINGIAVAGDAAVLATSLAPVTLLLDPAWGPAHNVALHAALADTALVFLITNGVSLLHTIQHSWIYQY